MRVKSIFKTLQGEGAESGMPAIFVRFAGCNMWNGKPEDRAKSKCEFCDTDFLGGNEMTSTKIAAEVQNLVGLALPYLIVLSGGEPMLQDKEELIALIFWLHRFGHKVQIETNGTVNAMEVFQAADSVTVSPKLPRAKLKVDWKYVNTLKLLYPHPTVPVEDFLDLPGNTEVQPMSFYIQPIDPVHTRGPDNTKASVALVQKLGLPWRLSLQTHKVLGLE
jgi:organic radical activating enzyme